MIMSPKPKRAPALQAMVDHVAKQLYGRTQTECQDKCCVSCGSLKIAPHDFRDALSSREYDISSLCQECQDSVFGTSEES